MQKIDIESSLRRINHKYIEELNQDEKEKAIQSFKKVYAEEMGKASGQISKRKKVHDNLNELEKQKEVELQAIEDEIGQRMVNFERNRSKQLESKLKEHRMLEENWKKRWETMIKKRRFSQMENLEKSEKVRKETEEFFNKKKDFVKTSKSKMSKHQEEDYYFKNSTHKASFGKGRSASIDHYKIAKSRLEGLPAIQRSSEGRNGFEKFITSSQVSSQASISNKPTEIKYNKQKFEIVKKQQEEVSFQKMVNKLARIEKNRMNVLERKERLVMQARKMRQQRENPDKIAKNRQRSLDALNLRRQAREEKSRSIEKQSKVSLNESITLHLQAKKQIEQSQFHRRQRNYSLKFQKLKKTKIDKLIKQAIVTLKHQTLNRDKL